MKDKSILSAHPVSDAMRATVQATLAELERRHDVAVLFACESGSRGWGFASPRLMARPAPCEHEEKLSGLPLPRTM